MRKERTLLFLGIWVTILPFLGFPNMWRSIFFVITGFSLIYLSYLFYKQTRAREPKDDNKMQSFVDSMNPHS
ncbi:MAG: hypothetical protein WC059_00870 [Candidatus Paceibacterota bacterium]